MPPRKTATRGYGTPHQRERRRWEQRLAAGEVVECARDCGSQIKHGDPWDLGHTDDRAAWTGPECVSCNRSAGGRNGAAATNAKRQIIEREW